MTTTAPRPRAVGYTRVSTAAQATEEKVSLDEQGTDIETYCESKDYELVEIYTDAGYSGASKRRPAFQRMCKLSLTRRFGTLSKAPGGYASPIRKGPI